MTVLADFDISTDLKVEFFIPSVGENLFIIGISELGGPNVLAGTGYFIIGQSLLGGPDILAGNESGMDWRNLNCETAQVQTMLGGTTPSAVYFQPAPAQASITLTSYDYDPTNNRAIRPGTPVRVRVARGEYEHFLFNGFIDTVNVSYTVDGPNVINITAFDSFKKVVNSRLALFDTTTDFPEGFVTPYEQLEVIAAEYGTAMHASSEPTDGEIPSNLATDVIPSNYLYEAIQVGLGLFWLDPATQEFVFIPRPSALTPPLGTPVIGNNHGDPNHLCMSNIDVASDYNIVYNSLRVNLASDTNTYVVREDQDSIDLYGVAAIDVTINTTDEIELAAWADRVFSKSPTKLVRSVETKSVSREGDLTQGAEFYPGELVGVKYQTAEMNIDEYYSVTKVSHFITPDNWFTTLELWKEV